MVEWEMINFPVDALWAIKSMLLRSISNPNAIKYTANNLLDVYKYIITMIFSWVIIRFLIKFTYKLIKKIKERKVKKEELSIKQAIKETFWTEKTTFKILKYPIIWSILVWTSWLQASVLFWIFSHYYETQSDIIRETLPTQENYLLWMSATYLLFILIIAWGFIWLSFWNKTLRNIWIIIYALWVLFVLFAHFLNNWAITNDLTNFTI